MINKENISTVTKNYFNDTKFDYEVVHNSITTFVPHDEANTDYQAIHEWVSIEGNEIIDNGGGE